MRVSRFFRLGILAILAAFLISACQPAGPATSGPATEVRVGSLNDLTGPTSDVGKDAALGVQEAVRWVNDNGGINGKPIKLFLYDYGYRVPEAITTYKRFRDFDKVAMVLGWGTGDTESLAPTVAKDKLVYYSHSFSAWLADPSKAPYNLFYGTDYSTNARAAITAWYDEVWLKSSKFAARRASGDKPRFVAFYGFATPYASAPIKAIKDQATLLGFATGPDQDVTLTALDTKSQVLAAKEFKPDLVWHGNTTMSVATALKDSYALALGADHIVNNWGFDENLVRLAGPAAEGVIGIAVTAFFGEECEAGAPKVHMETVKQYAQKYNPGVSLDKRLVRTTQGWVQVLGAAEALKRADSAGKLVGVPVEDARVAVKDAFETMRDWDPGLGAAPLNYTPTDHRPNSKVKLFVIKGGKFQPLKEVDLKARWANQWASSWLGW